MRRSLRRYGSAINVVSVLVASSWGCASAPQPPMTAAQEATYRAIQKCSSAGMSVQIDDVRQDGTYRAHVRGEPQQHVEFEECVRQERSAAWKDRSSYKFDSSLGAFVPPERRALVLHAYFTTVHPPAGKLTGVTVPPAVSKFRLNEQVVFFLGVQRSGRVMHGRFRWLRPDSSPELEQALTLSDAPGNVTWSWYAQTLPAGRLDAPGTWALEAYFDDEFVGRYEFVVGPR
jgi:hypothetical protein